MKLYEINNLIEAVAPIDGINSDGVIWFKSEATPEQRVEAQQIMDAQIATLEIPR